MMALSPIPLFLLGDDCEVRLPVESDYGGEYGEPFAMRRVRFEDSAEMARRGYVFATPAKGLLFVDAANTENAMRLPVEARVTVRGESMAVKKVTELKGFFGEVHHWECEVG